MSRPVLICSSALLYMVEPRSLSGNSSPALAARAAKSAPLLQDPVAWVSTSLAWSGSSKSLIRPLARSMKSAGALHCSLALALTSLARSLSPRASFIFLDRPRNSAALEAFSVAAANISLAPSVSPPSAAATARSLISAASRQADLACSKYSAAFSLSPRITLAPVERARKSWAVAAQSAPSSYISTAQSLSSRSLKAPRATAT